MSLVVIERRELEALIVSAVETGVREALAHQTSAPTADLISGAQMAERLGVSRATLHRMRIAGCPAIKLGDHYKFQPTRVLAWLESRSEAAP